MENQIGLKGQLKDEQVIWETVTGGQADEFWKPSQEGEQIQGKLVGSMDGSFGKTYLVEHDGRIIGLPSNIVLQNLLLKVPLSSTVRVTYEGTAQNERKQTYKVFRVEVARSGSPFA